MIFTVGLDYNVGMEKLGGNHLWGECGSWILEDKADNVIANMSFSGQLLFVSCAELNYQ